MLRGPLAVVRRPFRRPLFRAVLIGGAGYALGRRAGSNLSSVAPSQAEPHPVDRLKDLAALHDAGKLTDAEFEAAKRRLLGL